MNKLFTKIAALCLGATMAVGVGVAVASSGKAAGLVGATDYNTPTNYNLANNVPSGLTASTTLSKDSSGRGMGKAGTTYTLTTSTSFTDVGKIVVNAATNYSSYSSHSVSAKVGGSAFGSAQSFTAKASTNYTIEASKASGVVVVSLNNGKEGTTKTNTIWCLSIDVYTVATPVQTYTVSFVVNTAGYGTVSQSSITSVPSGSSITTNSNKVTINGTTVTATPSANTAQYTYAFTGWSNNTGTVTAARTITANFSRTTNTFTVDGSGITNGSIAPTSNVSYGADYSGTITPATNYTYPDSLTVTMGGNTLVADTDYLYDNTEGTLLIGSVTGNLVISGACVPEGTAYTVTYNPNSGTVSPASEQIVENGHPSFPTPTRSGYNFKGWQVNGSGTAYTDPEDYTVTGDVTFVASWVAVYTVTFNANGGSSTPAAQSVETGSTFTFPSAGTKTNWTFDGWTSTGSEPYYAVGATSPAVTGAITYTAHWTENAKVSVTYVCGDHGTGDPYVVSNVYVGSSHSLVSFATAGFTAASGYAFKCWSVGGVEKDPNTSITINAATTVTAVYKTVDEYTLYTSALVDGDYVLTHAGSDAITNTITSNRADVTSVTPVNDKITDPAASIVWTAESHEENSETYWTFYNAAVEKYLSTTGSNNQCRLDDDYSANNARWTVSLVNSKFSIINKSNSRYLRDNTGVNPHGFGCYASTTGENLTLYKAPSNQLDSIVISGYEDEFDSGDTFVFGGTVTAKYTKSADATVTSSATFHLDSASGSSMAGVTLTHASHDGHTIYVKYTEGGITKTATYEISVANAPVSSVSIGTHAAEIGLGESYSISGITPTVSPADAVKTTEWVVSGNTVSDDYTWNGTSLTSKTTEGTVTLRCRSTVDNSKYDELVVTISGDPVAAFAKDSTTGYAGKSETVSFTYGNFDAEDIEILSGNTSYVTIGTISASEGSGTVVINFVGAGSTSVTIGDGNDTLDTLTVTVSADSVVSVTWSASNIDVFSGATLSTTGWNVQYEMASGDTGSAESYTIKVGTKTVTAGYAFVAEDDGKTMHVEYGGVSSSSVSVAVTQSINNVYAPVPGEEETSTLTFTAACGGSGTSDGGENWTVTSDGAESNYDSTKGIHYGTSSAAVKYINLTSSDFTSGKITKVVVNASTASGVSATVAVNVGGSAFGGDPQSLSSSAANYTFEGEVDADEIEVIVTKPSSATKAIYCKSIAVTYVTESSETVNIANDPAHKAAQRAAVAYAQAFNAAMDETENCTTGLDAAWSTCASAYQSFKSAAAALGETEEAWAKNLVKYATAQYSDDSAEACLERMMKTYEICVQKHGKTAFMDDLVSLGRAPVNPIAVTTNENINTIAIVAIVSVISVSAIGGYFFLRKRKETN